MWAKGRYMWRKLRFESAEFLQKEFVETGAVFLDTEFSADGAVDIVVAGLPDEGSYLFSFEPHYIKATVACLPWGQSVLLQEPDKLRIPYGV